MASINPFNSLNPLNNHNRSNAASPGSPVRPVVQPRVNSAPADLDSLASAIDSAAKAISEIKSALSASPDSANLSATIAAHIEAINQAANAAQGSSSETLVIGVSSKVEAYDVEADLALGETLDVVVSVTQLVSDAELTLSFTSAGGYINGWHGIDLASPDEQFVIEVSGPEGAKRFSFASGTTIDDIVATFEAFAPETGVTAEWTEVGLKAHSTSAGGDSFVSVKVIDDGGAVGQGIIGDDGQVTPFAKATNTITDFGTDAEVTINGEVAEVDGDLISLESPGLSVSVKMHQISLGTFRALRLLGSRPTSVPDQEAQQAQLPPPFPPPVPTFPDQAQALREAVARGAFGLPSAGGASPFGKTTG